MEENNILYFNSLEEATNYIEKDEGFDVFLIKEVDFEDKKPSLKRILLLYQLDYWIIIDNFKYLAFKSVV